MSNQGDNTEMIQVIQHFFGSGDGQDPAKAPLSAERRKLKRNILLLLCTLIALVLFAPGGPLQAAPAMPEPADRSIYVFGDSWAQQMSDPLPTDGITEVTFDKALESRGFDSFINVHKHGVSGSTLAEWATDQNGMLTALATAITVDTTANPIAYFTLGGNDLRDGATPEQIALNLGIVLTALEGTRADLKIYYSSYDILNPDVQPWAALCNAGLMQLFQSTSPTVANNALVAGNQGVALVISQFSRTTYIDTVGSLQGMHGMPDLNSWSPVQYVSDCLHPNTAGYNLYSNTIFNTTLTWEICSKLHGTSAACPTIYLPIVMVP